MRWTLVLKVLCMYLSLSWTQGQVALPADTISTLGRSELAGLARRVDSFLVPSQVRSAQAVVESAQALDRSLFQDGIDKVSVGRTDFFSNHLVTNADALRIAEQGELFLQTAKTTATSLGVKVADMARIPSQGGFLGPMQPSCPFSAFIDCSSASGSRYRTIDGSCNNVANPYFGKMNTPFQRLLPPLYADGVGKPRINSVMNGVLLPGARIISTTFHENSSPADEMRDVSHLSMEFGQFISHDMQQNTLSKGSNGSNLDCCAPRGRDRPGCFPIDIPADDPFFSDFGRTCLNVVRAVATPNLQCSLGPRQQLNQNTHYVDASQVYGSDKLKSASLRTKSGGKLKTASAPGVTDLLPKDTSNNANCILPSNNAHVKCFKAGDVRANQQPALIALHTIFMREHNRIATKLSTINPLWIDQLLFDESRKIVGAILQHIIYNEYLPDILGDAAMTSNGLKPQSSGYFTGYDSSKNVAIYNSFSAAAFRFGHSMLRRNLRNTGGSSPNALLKDVFLNPSIIYQTGGGIDAVAKGLVDEASQKVDRLITDQVSNHLFERTPGFGGDLPATNVQRGRDHGIAFYQMWRQFCGLSGAFSHDTGTMFRLMTLYTNLVDIDLFTGGVSETPVTGGKVGPTFACIIAKQFESLKKRDRYFYENNGAQSFELGQLGEIRKQTMGKVLCRNTEISSLQKNVFIKDVTVSNPRIDCNSHVDIDFDQWRCAGWLPWGPFTECFGWFKFRLRFCARQNPRPCPTNTNPCPGDAFELTHCFRRRVIIPGRRSLVLNTISQSQLESELRRRLASGAANRLSSTQILQQAVAGVQRSYRPVRPPRIREPVFQVPRRRRYPGGRRMAKPYTPVTIKADPGRRVRFLSIGRLEEVGERLSSHSQLKMPRPAICRPTWKWGRILGPFIGRWPAGTRPMSACVPAIPMQPMLTGRKMSGKALHTLGGRRAKLWTPRQSDDVSDVMMSERHADPFQW